LKLNRTIVVSLLIVLAVGSAIFAAPMIGVDNPIYEFGEVLEGVFVIHTFVLTNMGDEPLTITRVTPSCGCTTTNLAKTTLARGESVELGAILDTVGYGGRTITKLITVESNDPKDAKPTLGEAGSYLDS
jgi:hypothetical protein